MIYKKPQTPLPENFGLDDLKIKKLEKFSEHMYWSIGWVSMLLSALMLIIWANRTTSPNIDVTSFILLYVPKWVSSVVLMLFVTLPVYAIFEDTWSVLLLGQDYSQYKKYKMAKKQYEKDWLEWLRTKMTWWQTLGGQRFEQEIGLLFKKRGYQVQLMGKTGDGGIDIVISEGMEEIIIQCKAHKNPIGPHVVRDLYGVLTHSKAKEAWVISVSRFTKGSFEFAKNKPIRLITIEDILTEKI